METSFKLPMATMQLSWAVPRVARSARGAVLAQMLELCVREQAQLPMHTDPIPIPNPNPHPHPNPNPNPNPGE